MIKLANAIEIWDTETLQPYARNARTHSPEQVARIAASITEFGFTNPILVDGQKGIIAGHGRLMAAQLLGMPGVPVIRFDHLTDAQRRAYILADNRLALDAGWDEDMLAAELDALRDDGFDLDLTGFTDDEIADLLADDEGGAEEGANDNETGEGAGAGSLAGRFLVPPFSVLNAREGWWQERKRAWLALGIRSEEGRDIAPTNVSKNTPDYMAGRGNNDGGSIFDPVLCEIAYRWFSPMGGTVLDPFVGVAVRAVPGFTRQLQHDANLRTGEGVEVGSDADARRIEARERGRKVDGHGASSGCGFSDAVPLAQRFLTSLNHGVDVLAELAVKTWVNNALVRRNDGLLVLTQLREFGGNAQRTRPITSSCGFFYFGKFGFHVAALCLLGKFYHGAGRKPVLKTEK